MDDDLKALEQLLDIRDETGRVSITFGLLATFYLKEPWTRPVREAVAEEAERYIALVRDSLVWCQSSKTYRVSRIRKDRFPSPGEWLPQREDGKTWEFGLWGGEHRDAASAFMVDAFGPTPFRKEEIGYFHVRLPLHWFVNHPGSFPEYVLAISKRLRPISGYGGIGLLIAITDEGRMATGPVLAPIAKRYPGLEIDDPLSTARTAAEGIKGGNWLTVLGEHWIRELGGLDYLRIRLDEPNFPFYPYDGGLVIQAGQRPQIGDTERGLWPRQYVTLAKVLKKLRIREHYQMYINDIFDHEAVDEWLCRFDGK